MKRLRMFIYKLASFGLKLLGRGSNFPGELALKLDKNILDYFKFPKIVIAVTGSAGKGSTTSIIAYALRKAGYTVAHNYIGSNMTPGIVSMLIENSTLSGKIKTDAIVCEVDERYTNVIFSKLKPQYVIVTNLYRDQPPRHGHVDLVFDMIKSALTKDMHLIINGDDPYLLKFNLDNTYNVTYYGINKNKYSYLDNKFNNINIEVTSANNNLNKISLSLPLYKVTMQYKNINKVKDFVVEK
jgi:UDP-N-acetylmuramate-alanine ligase